VEKVPITTAAPISSAMGILGDIIVVCARLSTILFVSAALILGPAFRSRPFGLE
jgi:hypothetical protein